MGFCADGAQRHGTRGEAFDDFFGGLDLIDRDGLAWVYLELKQAAQRHVATVLVVDELGVFFVGVEVVGARGVLQFGNGVGCPHVVFTAHAEGVFAACIEHAAQHRVIAESSTVHAQRFFGNLKHAHAFNLAGGTGEELGNRLAAQTNRFKQLRTAVTHVGRHAHFGHDFRQAFANRFGVVVDGFFSRQITRQSLVHLGQCFQRQVGVYSLRAVTCQHRKVMNFAG